MENRSLLGPKLEAQGLRRGGREVLRGAARLEPHEHHHIGPPLLQLQLLVVHAAAGETRVQVVATRQSSAMASQGRR